MIISRILEISNIGDCSFSEHPSILDDMYLSNALNVFNALNALECVAASHVNTLKEARRNDKPLILQNIRICYEIDLARALRRLAISGLVRIFASVAGSIPSGTSAAVLFSTASPFFLSEDASFPL